MADNRYYYFKDAKGNRHTVDKTAYDKDPMGFAKAFPGARMEVIDRKTGRRGDVSVKDASRVGDFGAHLFTGRTITRGKGKPNSSALGRAQQSVAQEKWGGGVVTHENTTASENVSAPKRNAVTLDDWNGGTTGKESELVKGLRAADMIRKRDEEQMPIDYTKPGAVKQMVGGARRAQKSLERRMEQAGQEAGRNAEGEIRRRNAPAFDLGNEDVNNNIVKTRGQLEKEMEESAATIADKNFADTFANMIAGERQAAEKRGFDAYLQRTVFSATPMGSTLLGTIAYNAERDPAKLQQNLLNTLGKNMESMLSDPNVAQKVVTESKRLGVDPEDYVKTALMPSIQNKLMSEYDKTELKEWMPRNTFVDIIDGLGDGFQVGSILDAALTKAQRQYRQRAIIATQNGENPYYQRDKYGVTEGVRSALSLASDVIGPGGGVLGGIGKGVGAASAKVFGNEVKTIARMANMSKLQRMFKPSILMRGAAETGANFGIYEGLKGAQSYSSTTDDVKLGEMLENSAVSAAHGAVSGATLGVVGKMLGGLGYNVGIKGPMGVDPNFGKNMLKGLGMKGVQIIGEGTAFYAGGNFNNALSGADTDWSAGNLLSNIMAAGIYKIVSTHTATGAANMLTPEKGQSYGDSVAVKFGTALYKAAMAPSAQGKAFAFTPDEKQQLFASGDKAGLPGKEGSFGRQDILTWAERVMKATPVGKEDKSGNVKVAREYYESVMQDPNVSWDAKMKLNALLGIAPATRPEMDMRTYTIEDGKRYVNEYAKDGTLLSKRSYKNMEQREAIEYDLMMQKENQRMLNGLGYILNRDCSRMDLQMEFLRQHDYDFDNPDSPRNQAIMDDMLGNNKTLTLKRGRTLHDEWLDFVSENGITTKLIKDIADAHGLSVEEMFKIVNKEPIKRTEEEQRACVELRKALNNIVYEDGMPHADQADSDGKDVVEENNLGTENPNNEAVAEVLNNMKNAEKAFNAALESNDVLKQEYERLTKEGLSEPQIYMELINSGLTQEQLAPYADYINAKAKAVGMYRGTEQKIAETVQKHVEQWSYKGELNGEKQEGGQMLFVKDNNGRLLIVGAGDVAFDSEGRARENVGDMLSVLDPNTKEMDFVSKKDVQLDHVEKTEDYAKNYQEMLEVKNSVAYAESEKGKEKSEESEGGREELRVKSEESNGNVGNESSEAHSYTLSEKKAGNGEPFYQDESGNIDLATIPDEVFEGIGYTKAPFRLTPSMIKHMLDRHNKELGFKDEGEAINFVVDVMNNFDHVRLGYDGALVFSIENGRKRTGKRAVTVLINSDNGEFYGLKTSGYEGIKGLEKRPLLWERGANETSSTDAASASVTTGKGSISGEQSGSASHQGNGLHDKDSNNSPYGNGSNETLTFADGSPVPMMKDTKGRETADYSQMTPEQGAEWMSSQFGENAEAAVDGQIKRAEKMLKEAEKIKVDYTGDLNDAKEAEAQKVKAVDAAKAELELYTNIKKVMTANKVKAGIEKVGAVGEEGSVSEAGNLGAVREKFESGKRIVGNKRTRTLADGSKLRGHYEIVEADSLTPSHNANDGYKKSEGFPVNEEGRTINDRDYENDKDAQRVTDMIARHYDGQAVDQVPVVTADGIVVDGNGRTMAGQKAAKDGTDGAYLEALKENAENYGFTAEQIEQSGMKHPRLVLVSDEPMKYDTATFAKFNMNEKKSQGNTQQAVANSKKLSTDEISVIVSEIEGSGSLDAFFNNPTAINSLLKRLIDKGVIGLNEVAGLREGEDKLSAAGKDFVKNLLLGSVFSENTIRMMGADAMLKTKALNGIRAVTDNMKLGDYALMKEIDQAVQLLYEARQGGSGVDAYLRTPAMFGENAADRFDPISQAIALALEGKAEDFRELMMAYNRNAASYADANQTEMFGERPTKEDFVKEFLKFRNWKDYETRHSSKEGNGDAGSSEGGEPETSGGNGRRRKEGLAKSGDKTLERKNIGDVSTEENGGALEGDKEGKPENDNGGSPDRDIQARKGQRQVDKAEEEKSDKPHEASLALTEPVEPTKPNGEEREGELPRTEEIEGDLAPQNKFKAYIESRDQGLKQVSPVAKALKEAVESGDKKRIKNAQKDLVEAILASPLGHGYLSSYLSICKNTKKNDKSYNVNKALIKPLTEVIKTIESALDSALKDAGLEGVHLSYDENGEGWIYADKNSPWYAQLKALDNDYRNISQIKENDPIAKLPQITLDNVADAARIIKSVIEEGERYNEYTEKEELNKEPLSILPKKEENTLNPIVKAAENYKKDHPSVRMQKVDDADYIENIPKEYRDFSDEHKVNPVNLFGYGESMKYNDSAAASRYLHDLKAMYLREHVAEKKALMEREGVSGLIANRRLFAPIEKAIKEKYGDVDVLIEERKKRVEAERNVMEAARKRAEEEERKRQQHLEELSLIPDGDLDKRYLEAMEKGDEATAREMIDESARRKGYGDAESDYQGVGAWSAPSDPGFATAEERRADVKENGGDVNVEDIAAGYSPVQEEMYSHPERTGFGDEAGIEAGRAINDALNALKAGKTDVKIKVYRAVPTSVKEGKLRNGDWVTPSRKYAEMHGEHRLDGKYRIMEDEVPASELWFDGNDIREWGYDNGKSYRYKNVKNNRKLNDLVTRDDKGNVIPPSKRFNQRKADERYQRGVGGVKPSKAEVALRDAVIDRLRENGMDVIADEAEGQRVLDEVNGRGETVRSQAMLSSLTKAVNTIRGWLATGKRGKSFTIELPEATQRMIRKVMGRDFDSHNITANGVAHAQKNHGVNGNKISDSSIPLREQDMELMPYIMVAPDYVRKGSEDVTGRTSVRFYKELSNGYVVVAEKEYKNSPDDMETITMWAEMSDKATNAQHIAAPDTHARNAILDIDAAKIRKDAEDAIVNDVKVRENRVYHGSGSNGVRFFRTANGEAYGFTVGGKIYIDPKIATSETPVHEYAHLWAEALRNGNSKEWKNIVELMKDTKVWDEVKARYPELKSDGDIADEVIATYSGRRGAERLREELRKITAGNGGVFEKIEAISAFEKVRQSLEKFWKGVADFLHIRYTSAEEVADRVMKDLLDGVDPRGSEKRKVKSEKSNGNPRFQFIGEKGAAEAYNKAKAHYRMELGDTFSDSKEHFDAVRDRAVEEKGIVMPNLNKEKVKVVEVEKHLFGENKADAIKNARTWAKDNLATKNGDMPTMRDGTPYIISKAAIDKYLSNSAISKSEDPFVHLSVLPKLTDVIHESIEAEIHPDYKKGEDGTRGVENGYGEGVLVHRLYGAVELDGKMYRVKTTMQEFRGGEENKPHSYEVTKIELLDSPGKRETPDRPPLVSSNNSIDTAKLLQGVEKSYDSSKKLLDESKNLTDGETFFRKEGDGVVTPEKTSNAMSERIIKTVEKVSKQTGGKVKMVSSVEEIENPKVRKDIENGKQVTGWYDEKTGEVHLYMPNIHDSYTAEKTVWHETVGHKGMRGLLGDKFNDYMRGLWMDLDNPINAELRAYVKEKMNMNHLGFYDAIEEFIAKSAEEGKGEPGFWNYIKNKVTDALHEIGYRVSPNVKDVKYMLWLAKNVQKHGDSPLWKMRAEAVRWKIEHEKTEYTKIEGGELYDNDGKSHDFESMSREEWLEATDGEIHYRTAPSAATALDRYHHALDRHSYMATEAFMDNMLSLKKLMEAIDPSIRKIEDVNSSMNPYLMQNITEGMMSDKSKLFEIRYMDPLSKAMSSVLDSFDGKKVEDRIRNFNLYMIRKHGLERNRVLFVRDKIREERKVKSEESDSIDALETAWKGEKYDLRKKLDSGQIDLKEYYRQMDEWIVQNLDKDFKAEEHDYSGMHGLQGIADKKAAYDDAGAIDEVMSQEASMESMKQGSVADFWKKVKAATDYSVNSDYESGLISKNTHDGVLGMFDWYVPLRKFDEATAEDVYGYVTEMGDPSNYIGTTLMNAKGRKSLSNVEILAQIGLMGNRAIRNGGQNMIKQAFARFVRNSGEQNLVKETKVWVEKTGTDLNGNDIWEEAYPQIPEGASADDVASIVDAFETDMRTKQAKGEAKSLSNGTDIGFKFQRAKDKSQHFVDVKIAGRTHRFVVLGNPRAAQALNGMLENGKASQKWLQTVTRWMAMASTSWSPEFVMRNIVRDMEFASSHVAAKEGGRYAKKWARYYGEINPLNVFYNEGAGAMKSMKWKDFKNGVGFGLYARYREGTLGNSKMERYFKEFMENGGETGFVQLFSMHDMEKSYKSIVEKESAKGANKVMVNAVEVLKKLGKNVENLNEVAENMARFATYCTSRDLGRSAARSAYDAKEVSTNFNRHGSGDAIKSFKNGEMGDWQKARRNTYGFVAGYLRNYSMFFNAGIQSTNLLFKNIKRAPVGTAVAMTSAPFALALIMAAVNNAIIQNEDDKDRGNVKDPYGELPDYIRRNNLCIYVGNNKFVTVPLAIELRAFYSLGDLAAGQTFAKNVKSQRNMAMDAVGCMSQLFPVMDFLNNPNYEKSLENGVGMTTEGIAPTAIVPFIEWWLNNDWKGAPIRRTGDKTELNPAWQNAYNNVPARLVDLNKWVNAKTNNIAPGNPEMKGNEVLDWATDPSMLNHFFGSWSGGMGTFTQRTAGLGAKATTGKTDEIEVGDVPFLRSLFYTPREQSSMARTKAKWYNYKEEMEQTIANNDKLKSKNVPTMKRIENAAALEKFEGSAEQRKVNIIKNAEKRMRHWNTMRKKWADDKKQVDFANKNIEMIMQEAVEDLDRIE